MTAEPINSTYTRGSTVETRTNVNLRSEYNNVLSAEISCWPPANRHRGPVLSKDGSSYEMESHLLGKNSLALGAANGRDQFVTFLLFCR